MDIRTKTDKNKILAVSFRTKRFAAITEVSTFKGANVVNSFFSEAALPKNTMTTKGDVHKSR
jgi:hypothetical protein